MANINEEFPSKYLKAADLRGHAVRVTINTVQSEQISNDRRLVMYFSGRNKGMVLNKTNARTIADVFGDDTDAWAGAEIEVFAMKVDFQGRMVDGLRVRVPPVDANRPKVAANARDRGAGNWQAPPTVPADHNPPAPAAAYDNGFDDDIQF